MRSIVALVSAPTHENMTTGAGSTSASEQTSHEQPSHDRSLNQQN